MTTQTFSLHADDDTQQVSRSALSDSLPRRLAEMDLDPPSGPVPADVLAYLRRPSSARGAAGPPERSGAAHPHHDATPTPGVTRAVVVCPVRHARRVRLPAPHHEGTTTWR